MSKKNTPETPQPEVVNPFLVHNYSNVLNIVDAAAEILAECIKLQLVTVKGEKKRQITPENLLRIAKALAVIRFMYKNEHLLLAPPKEDDDKREPPAKRYGTYEDMVRASMNETKQ